VHHVGILYDQFMMHGQRNIKLGCIMSRTQRCSCAEAHCHKDLCWSRSKQTASGCSRVTCSDKSLLVCCYSRSQFLHLLAVKHHLS